MHPPLGKWLISLGMQLFGAQNTFSWRISTAVAGILAVVLLMLITQYLLRSVLVTTIAGCSSRSTATRSCSVGWGSSTTS